MNNDVKPVIDPHTNDNYINNSNKNIKIAIVLTIILLGVVGFIVYSIRDKIGSAGYIGDKDDKTQTTETITSVDPSTYIKQLNITETDDVIVLELMNTSSITYDISVYVNTYVGNDISNTYSEDIIAVKGNDITRVLINKDKLGIYDKYDIKYGANKSIYKSLISNDLLIEEDSALVDNKLYFDIINNTGKTVDKLTVIVLFLDNKNNIIDAKTSSVYGIKETGNITVNDSTKDYSNKSSYIIEAYTI